MVFANKGQFQFPTPDQKPTLHRLTDSESWLPDNDENNSSNSRYFGLFANHDLVSFTCTLVTALGAACPPGRGVVFFSVISQSQVRLLHLSALAPPTFRLYTCT